MGVNPFDALTEIGAVALGNGGGSFGAGSFGPGSAGFDAAVLNDLILTSQAVNLVNRLPPELDPILTRLTAGGIAPEIQEARGIQQSLRSQPGGQSVPIDVSKAKYGAQLEDLIESGAISLAEGDRRLALQQQQPTGGVSTAGSPTSVQQLLLGLLNGGSQGVNVAIPSGSGSGLSFGGFSPTGIPGFQSELLSGPVLNAGGLGFTGGAGVLQAPPSGGNGILDTLGDILNGPGAQPGGGVLAPTSTGGGSGGIGDIFGDIGDVLGQIPGVGGILEGGSDILGQIIGPVLGGIFGGSGSGGGAQATAGSGQAGGINVGQILGSLLGGGGQGGGGNLGAILGALAGGLFGENLNEARAELRQNVAPISAEEAALLGINTQLAQGQLDAFNQARGVQGQTGSALSQALQSLAAERQAANAGGLGALQGQEAVASVADSAGQRDVLNQAQQNVLAQQARGGVADPATQALIEQQAQLARDQGLSDLNRFTSEAAEQIRLSAAGRGLRSYDTPILNRFDDLGAESARAAENLIRGIQQQQVASSLQLPLQQGQLGLSQLGALGSTSLGARGLNEQIGRGGLGQQLGAGLQAGQIGLGLGTGSGANQTLGIAQAPRLNTRVSESIGNPSALEAFGNTTRATGALFEDLGLFR